MLKLRLTLFSAIPIAIQVKRAILLFRLIHVCYVQIPSVYQINKYKYLRNTYLRISIRYKKYVYYESQFLETISLMYDRNCVTTNLSWQTFINILPNE